MTYAEMDSIRKLLGEYRKEAEERIARNSHMNEMREGEVIDPRHIDAVLVDFMNYFAGRHGLDFGMYTADLKKAE